MHHRYHPSTPFTLAALALLTALPAVGLGADDKKDAPDKSDEPGVVHCANLIYARDKSTVCFADHFLADAQKQSNIRTSGRFTPVHAESDALFEYPFAVMSGEGGFTLTPAQRKNLRRYLTGGGFLVASPGCSSRPWNHNFQREFKQMFPDRELETLPLTHPIFHTVYDIKKLKTKKENDPAVIKALKIDGRIALIYSPDGLNDTKNAGGNCCCCGGNEILNARQVNVNLLAYALTH